MDNKIEEREFEFYGDIKEIGGGSNMLLVPKTVMDISQWKKGDNLRIRAVKIIN